MSENERGEGADHEGPTEGFPGGLAVVVNGGLTVADRIGLTAPRLTASERRVAEVVLDDLKIVAFGTVAQLAARSNTSGPTVLRFAVKRGFQGFADLQAASQTEIVDALRPATE